jgi:hypothetical protein
MFKNWFTPNVAIKIGFEDIKFAIQNPDKYILINTLGINEQSCLIKNTVPFDLEEKMVNDLLDKFEFNSRTFLIYGKNTSDNSVDVKYNQLRGLGFSNIYIYPGGVFEWLLLQDIYGNKEFPTSGRELDVLKHRVLKTFSNSLFLT